MCITMNNYLFFALVTTLLYGRHSVTLPIWPTAIMAWSSGVSLECYYDRWLGIQVRNVTWKKERSTTETATANFILGAILRHDVYRCGSQKRRRRGRGKSGGKAQASNHNQSSLNALDDDLTISSRLVFAHVHLQRTNRKNSILKPRNPRLKSWCTERSVLVPCQIVFPEVFRMYEFFISGEWRG